MRATDLGAAPGFPAVRLPGAEIHRQTAIGTVLLLHLQKHGIAIHEIEITLRRIVSAGAVGFEALIRVDGDPGQFAELGRDHERVVARAQRLDGWARGDERHCSLPVRKCPRREGPAKRKHANPAPARNQDVASQGRALHGLAADIGRAFASFSVMRK